MLAKIKERALLIQKELQSVGNNVKELEQALEQGRQKYQQLTGHYNEANFVLNELQILEKKEEEGDLDSINHAEIIEPKEGLS